MLSGKKGAFGTFRAFERFEHLATGHLILHAGGNTASKSSGVWFASQLSVWFASLLDVWFASQLGAWFASQLGVFRVDVPTPTRKKKVARRPLARKQMGNNKGSQTMRNVVTINSVKFS